MEYQSLLHKKLQSGNFIFTAETTPPDASDKEVFPAPLCERRTIFLRLPVSVFVIQISLELYH